jgi:transcription antitermination factor NusG
MYDGAVGAFAEPIAFAGIDQDLGSERWFAVHTYARHEKVVAQAVREQGIASFLPLVKQVRQWSDRRKVVELPLFGCYVFVKISPTSKQRVRVLQTNGVLSFVGTHGMGIPIPEKQIEAVRLLVEEQLPVCSHPFLKVGQRVRIRSGALAGMEGILVSRSGERALVISLDAIQRSLSISVQGYDVAPV